LRPGLRRLRGAKLFDLFNLATFWWAKQGSNL
jgi:hypothetical protein